MTPSMVPRKCKSQRLLMQNCKIANHVKLIIYTNRIALEVFSPTMGQISGLSQGKNTFEKSITLAFVNHSLKTMLLGTFLTFKGKVRRSSSFCYRTKKMQSKLSLLPPTCVIAANLLTVNMALRNYDLNS